MIGVEILKETAVYDTIMPVWGICITVLVGVVLFWAAIIFPILYVMSKDITDKDCFKSIGIACLALATVSMLVFIIGMTNKTTPAYTEYKVIVDDSVPLNEFIEKYEIIDQEGNIYTVKEK